MNSLKSTIQTAVLPIHKKLRRGKCELLLRILGGKGGTLLDVGGGLGMDGEFEDFYRRFRSVTVVNLHAVDRSNLPKMDIRVAIANGCALPFEDKSFDWVFSNAVIEHVGNASAQSSFASEIRRVARKGYCVTTPNRYFPIEPHALLPLYQFYPPKMQRWSMRFSPGYMREPEEIRLLSKLEMQCLFPEAQIAYSGIFVGLIALHRRNAFWASMVDPM
jgi:ubiquinone/menaquinone biosynthesis C-methylase UbiE